jgi:hypothetical protein
VVVVVVARVPGLVIAGRLLRVARRRRLVGARVRRRLARVRRRLARVRRRLARVRRRLARVRRRLARVDVMARGEVPLADAAKRFSLRQQFAELGIQLKQAKLRH